MIPKSVEYSLHWDKSSFFTFLNITMTTYELILFILIFTILNTLLNHFKPGLEIDSLFIIDLFDHWSHKFIDSVTFPGHTCDILNADHHLIKDSRHFPILFTL